MAVHLHRASSATVSFTTPQEMIISHLDDSIRIGDGTFLVTTTAGSGGKRGLDSNIINTVDVNIVSGSTFPTEMEISNDSGNPIPVSGTVELGVTSLAALEDINVTGEVELGATSLAALENITVNGTVALDTASLNALETITVNGEVELGATSLSALENITVNGEVELGATSLAALENITVNGTVAIDPASLAALENITVNGEVELGATSLAALENITVDGEVSLAENTRQKIIKAEDLQVTRTWADFGTKNERQTQVLYTAASVPGFTAKVVYNYTLISGKYQPDGENWSII